MDYTVDVDSTAAYLDIYNEPCDCLYCRNYQSAFPDTYSDIVKILQTFGICFNRPLEVMDFFWNETRDKRIYHSYYSVKGELNKDGLVIYSKRNTTITLYQPDTDIAVYKNTGMAKPYFIIEVFNIQLPWVLAELPDD